ncbi:hemolysin D [Pelagibaculum spongiae]|uniref:Hemolysin D n=1 Tax=Pelagibaculum spongiae TaxID=2080658 RepID=A0A2V1H5Y9_9GAMM|nr:hemolysin D [Pelagibaculum spongiae]
MAVVLLGLQSFSVSHAFTQSGAGAAIVGNGTPMGHEWLTKMSAFETIGQSYEGQYISDDPRRSWQKGLAKKPNLHIAAQAELNRLKQQIVDENRYDSKYEFIRSAIIGQRWVDIGGFSVAKGLIGKYDCFDLVAQEPAELQQDHFMRRYDDIGGQGAINAATRGQQRFIDHFINAAMASQQQIKVWDGGGYSKKVSVDYRYFLFGRAVHIFQDSFSPEHTVRLPVDNYEMVRQVKSYLCAEGSEQHSHAIKDQLTYESGDVIWNEGTRVQTGWDSYNPGNMKAVALTATEASKDLWAAFLRTTSVPKAQREAVAMQEAQSLVNNWLSFNKAEMLGWYGNLSNRDDSYVLMAMESVSQGANQQQCMVGLGVESGNQQEKIEQFEQGRETCLYNIEAEPGYEDLYDPYMGIPLNWRWKYSSWQDAPEGFQLPQPVANSGRDVTIRSQYNGHAITAPDGLSDNNWIYNQSGSPVVFTQVPNGLNPNSYYFRARDNADLFLSYREATGAVKLENSPKEASFTTQYLGDAAYLLNDYWQDHMWLNKRSKSPYVTDEYGRGDKEARWSIEQVD